MNIFTFTWNMAAADYDEPDVAQQLVDKIVQSSRNYHIVAFATQEADWNSTFLSRNITDAFAIHDWNCIEHIHRMGLGVTTLKSGKIRGLQLYVFVAPGVNNFIANVHVRSVSCPSILSSLFRCKGAVSITLDLKDHTNNPVVKSDSDCRLDCNTGRKLAVRTEKARVQFVNMHLPFDSNTLLPSQPITIRNQYLEWQDWCFKYLLYHSAVHDSDCPTTHTFRFVCGDLNYRIRKPHSLHPIAFVQHMLHTLESTNLINNNNPIRKHDELYMEMSKGLVPCLWEGINNRGPTFLPTTKLRKGCTVYKSIPPTYKLGRHQQRTPSWCDRILYICDHNSQIHCRYYNVYWEIFPNVVVSDHVPVVGVYECNLDPSI